MIFAVDHLVIRTAAMDALTARIATLTGLPPLDGFQPGGQIASRGVRFAGGPFLDIFQAERPMLFLGLGGPVADAERIARERGWDTERESRPPAPTGDDPPWDMLYVSKAGGVLKRAFVIEYFRDRAAFDAPSYRGPLHKTWLAPQTGPRLARVWVTVEDMERAASDLAALGYADGGPLEGGRLWRGPTDLVVSPSSHGRETVTRFDVAGALAEVDEPFGEQLRLVATR